MLPVIVGTHLYTNPAGVSVEIAPLEKDVFTGEDQYT